MIDTTIIFANRDGIAEEKKLPDWTDDQVIAVLDSAAIGGV